MFKAILLLSLLAGLSACTEYQGRTTNCWSSSSMSFVESATAPSDCDWLKVSG